MTAMLLLHLLFRISLYGFSRSAVHLRGNCSLFPELRLDGYLEIVAFV